MPIFGGSSDSEEERTMHQQTKLFNRQRSIHSIFGGGKGIYVSHFFDFMSAKSL